MRKDRYVFFNPITLGLLSTLGLAFLLFAPKILGNDKSFDKELVKLSLVFFYELGCLIYAIVLLVFTIKGNRFSRNKLAYSAIISIAILLAGYGIAYAPIGNGSGAVAYYTTRTDIGFMTADYFKKVPVYISELIGYSVIVLGQLSFLWLLYWQNKPRIFRAMVYFFPLYLGILLLLYLLLAGTQRHAKEMEQIKGQEYPSWEQPVHEKADDGLPLRNDIDREPAFPGGEEAMYQYIREEMNYSDFPEGYQQDGKVVVSFKVSPNGELYSIRIQKGLNVMVDQKVVEAFRDMPKWKPPKHNGMTITVVRQVSIAFSDG